MNTVIGHRVLVADDDPTSLLLLSAMLENAGLAVDTAPDGAAACALAAAAKPDLVILDVMMPVLDGYSACARLKADQATADIPIIFVTALDDTASKLKGLSIGGVDYITKPFYNEEVLARVRVHLRLRTAMHLLLESQRQRLEGLRSAHRSFLTDLDALPDARCAVVFEPAEEAGGDQYDAFPLGPGLWGYFVADIAGHGLETAFLSSVLKALFRENAPTVPGPAEAFQRINGLMREYLADGQHITAAFLTIDRQAGLATLVSAGHLPPVVQHPDGSLGQVEAEGDVLGVFPKPVFVPTVFPCPPGTRVWLYSDGIVEDFSRTQSHRRGIARLGDAVAATSTLSCHDAVSAVAAGLFTGTAVQDDRLILVAES